MSVNDEDEAVGDEGALNDQFVNQYKGDDEREEDATWGSEDPKDNCD